MSVPADAPLIVLAGWLAGSLSSEQSRAAGHGGLVLLACPGLPYPGSCSLRIEVMPVMDGRLDGEAGALLDPGWAAVGATVAPRCGLSTRAAAQHYAALGQLKYNLSTSALRPCSDPSGAERRGEW